MWGGCGEVMRVSACACVTASDGSSVGTLISLRFTKSVLLQLLRGHVRVGFSKFINVGLAGCAYCTTSPSVKGLVSMGAWACIGAVRVQALATTAQPAIMSMQQGGTRPVLCTTTKRLQAAVDRHIGT